MRGSDRSVAHKIAMDDLVLVQTMERAEALASDFLQALHLLDGSAVHYMSVGWGGRRGAPPKNASSHAEVCEGVRTVKYFGSRHSSMYL